MKRANGNCLPLPPQAERTMGKCQPTIPLSLIFFFALLNVSAVSFVRRGSPPDVFRGKSVMARLHYLQ